MSGVPCVWVGGERIGEHVHVDVRTGTQYGQGDMPTGRIGHAKGYANDNGKAGDLIMHADQWPSFIRALAVGGHATGLRVIWRYAPDDNRWLWNGSPDAPCIVGEREPVPWVREPAG